MPKTHRKLSSTPSTCHPDSPVYSSGLCRRCYMKTRYHKKDQGKRASCHPDRRNHAKGFCGACYARQQKAKKSIRSTCHPDRPHHAKGFCAACYADRRTVHTSPQCHPDRPLHGDAKCKPCYMAAYQEANAVKLREHGRVYRAANQQKHKASQRLRYYGIKEDEYQAALTAQGHLCKLCLLPLALLKKPSVDHDHATGRNRGIVCHGCNFKVGYVEKARAILPTLLHYCDNAVLMAENDKRPQCNRLSRPRWLAYQVSDDDFQLVLEAQGYRCKICSSVFKTPKTTHVDHDHRTGRNRGLLCSTCNVRIGFIEKYRSSIPRILQYCDSAVFGEAVTSYAVITASPEVATT